jgi:hypothetical protein
MEKNGYEISVEIPEASKGNLVFAKDTFLDSAQAPAWKANGREMAFSIGGRKQEGLRRAATSSGLGATQENIRGKCRARKALETI